MRVRIQEWLIAVMWLGALISLYMWNGGASVWFLIMLTVIFMLGGLALQWFGAHHIEIKRTVNPVQLTSGTEVEVEVYIEFRSVLPLPWMSITDYFTEGSYNKLWFPGWRRSYTYRYYLQNLPRGITTYQVCHVEWGGLFRWFKNSYLLPCEEDIIVLPIPATISSEHGWSSQYVREGEQLMQQQQRPTDIWGLEVRDYYEGDPLSRIHWKSSARRGRLQTRLLEELEDHEICIILDHYPQSYTIIDSEVGSHKNATRELFEGAVSVAAGLLQIALDDGVHVELINGDGNLKTPIVSTSPYITLAIIEPNGTKRISEVMEDVDQLVPGTRVAVITGGLDGELPRAVASLQRKGLTVDIYSVFSCSPLSNKNGEDVERTRQDTIANSLQCIGARLFRFNIASSGAKSGIDDVSVKEVKSYDGSYTERRNRYV